MDVEEAAERLYAVAPDAFVAERTALAAAAKQAGDAAGAAAIRRLPKPSQPAWQVNQLVRDRPSTPAELAEVAAGLRAAAEAGDPAGMRRADAERRRLVAELADRAAALAEQAGRPTTAAVRRDVEATLQAALTSPAAAEQLASGRLAASLFDTGLDALGMLTLAPAAPRGASAASPPRSTAPAAPRAGRTPSAAQRRESERAAAAEALSRAQAALREAKAQAARTRSLADQLAEEVGQLTARLEAVRRRAATAAQEADAADAAERAASAAQERARAALDALPDA